ncbi:MAG: molybdopterin dinucleotide binding domain-containing protein [Candidatus Bathyarchaeota archaeon]|nr:molybdopterin dinucleotide binding domain-containing protein [Candidatus Bathyarchaeota archaeon]MDD4326049.1 molybdopterin dinucleotide binding domain-containing protein [Candidatus Bathyarchaeota archaeon]MDI9577095.1 molybdopterin dinucleotide binding domain-containing protein [Thermoproteota archaeon]NLD66269.1 molybdopterin dinucleotide-binding protein [Thermoproteota archaeon]
MVEKKLRATLITGRTIDQGVGKELGKGSQEYFDNVAVCFLDKADMIKLGLKPKMNIRVTSKFGSVVVKVKKFPRGANPGIVFMPCGLWANMVCGDETYSMGMPLYKGFAVEVEPAPNDVVLGLDELMKKEYGR